MSHDVPTGDIGPGKLADRVAGVAVYRVQVGADGKPICGIVGKRGTACKHRAGYGTEHPGFGACKFHLGQTAPSGVGAARQEALARVDEMKRLGLVDEETSPDDALMEEVARSQAAVEYFDAQVKELTDDPDCDMASPRATKIVWHWNEQRRLLANVSRLVVQAGIATRYLELQEMQAAAVLTALLSVIGSPELGLDPTKVDIAKRMMATRLRELTTAPENREELQQFIDV